MEPRGQPKWFRNMTGNSHTLPLCALLSILFCATACVAPTPYQPAQNGAGYSERSADQDRQLVSFTGNALTSQETVENGMLLRAAELTLQKGYDYFVLEDQTLDKATTRIRLPNASIGGVEQDSRLGIPRTGAVESYYPMDSYQVTGTISLHRGPAPQGNAKAHDARATRQKLQALMQAPTAN